MPDQFVLGINVSHDLSCAIVRNGILICAITEERLNRIKHYSGGIDNSGMTNKHLPQKSIQYCLEAAGVSLDRVDLIVVSTCVVVNYEDYSIRRLEHDEILNQFPVKVETEKVHIVGHHLGHAASAFFPTEFEEAAIIVADGGGGLISINDGEGLEEGDYEERITIYHGHQDQIDLIHRFVDGEPSPGVLCNPRHCSLGDFYQSATIFAGFDTGDEGKTMGLAPYGDNLYFEDFMKAIQMDHGSLAIDPQFQFNKLKERNQRHYHGQYGNPRTSIQKLREVDGRVAAAAQYALEETLIKIASLSYEKIETDNLCMAGGVALNSVANKKILDRTPFKNIYVQPASGDDGCALGNALLGWNMLLGKPRKWLMNNAYLGRSYSEEKIGNAIKKFPRWCYPVKGTGNILEETSRLLADKNIVGWFQGGSEFGPRALGHRSILADARFPGMKGRLNRKVKHREGFRPFAPSILDEHNSEYFDLDCASPYMLLIAKVKNPEGIPAVSHVDGTARVQTVTKKDNGIYYDLIQAFYNLTGTPVILNTSFNVAGEPIVETPEDAINCFLRTNIDYLVLGDTLICKYKLRCLFLKIWPQELERIFIKQLKKWYYRFPGLKKLKHQLDRIRDKSEEGNFNIPG